MIRKGFLVAIVCASLTACGSSPERSTSTDPPNDTWYVIVDTPQGDVPCIVYDGYNAGGISCNWSASRPQ